MSRPYGRLFVFVYIPCFLRLQLQSSGNVVKFNSLKSSGYVCLFDCIFIKFAILNISMLSCLFL